MTVVISDESFACHRYVTSQISMNAFPEVGFLVIEEDLRLTGTRMIVASGGKEPFSDYEFMISTA
jgi:hypothetical protein